MLFHRTTATFREKGKKIQSKSVKDRNIAIQHQLFIRIEHDVVIKLIHRRADKRQSLYFEDPQTNES